MGKLINSEIKSTDLEVAEGKFVLIIAIKENCDF